MINFFWFSPGVAYTSECFHCKPGTHSANPGSARCTPCPADTYSNKGATTCQECEEDKYAGMPVCLSLSRWSKAFLQTYNCYVPHTCKCSSYCLVVKLIFFSGLKCVLCVFPHPKTFPVVGSASCKPRPACTSSDYFYTHTPCDSEGKVMIRGSRAPAGSVEVFL